MIKNSSIQIDTLKTCNAYLFLGLKSSKSRKRASQCQEFLSCKIKRFTMPFCTGFALISWADLEVLAAKVANEKDWIKIKRANGVPSQGGGQGGGDIISSAFGASWPVKLGRVDSEQPDPAGRVPLNDASVKDLTVLCPTWFYFGVQGIVARPSKRSTGENRKLGIIGCLLII